MFMNAFILFFEIALNIVRRISKMGGRISEGLNKFWLVYKNTLVAVVVA